MVKIFEMQQQVNDITNCQSRIVELDSFQEYLQNLNDRSLPVKHNVSVGKKFVDFEKKTVTFHFEHNLQDRWIEFVHYAEVIHDSGIQEIDRGYKKSNVIIPKGHVSLDD